MYKKILSLFLSAFLLFTGCNSAFTTDSAMNAENYSGLPFDNTTGYINEPETIPYSEIEAVETTETSYYIQKREDVSEDYNTLGLETTPKITTVKPEALPGETNFEAWESAFQAAPTARTALNYKTVKGVWISYIELSTILTGKSKDEFTKNIQKVYNNCISVGINTVYVHARAFGDAFYSSDYFPYSKHLTGTIGKEPQYDAFKIMIDEAHKRNISFQAWINPFRMHTDQDISSVNNSFKTKQWFNNSKTKGKYIVKEGNYWYLNPAYSECRELIENGAAEILSKYNVDGIHIDDYFYPTTDASFDKQAFSASGQSELSVFRMANCDKVVKGLYNTVKKINPSAVFGVSMQGSISNNYNFMYADVKKWCAEKGFVDYVAPQIYFGFENSTEPYEKCVKAWQELVKDSGIPLIIGLGAYKLGETDTWAGKGKNEWINETEILKRQIVTAKSMKNYAGVIFYSYNSLFNNKHTALLKAEIKAFMKVL